VESPRWPMFMRLDDLDGGRIMYGDIDITTYSLEEMAKDVFLHASTPKLSKTLLENIRYAGADVVCRRVDAVLRKAVWTTLQMRSSPDTTRPLVGGRLYRAVSRSSWLIRSLFSKLRRHAGRAHNALDPASRNDVMNLLRRNSKVVR
jgi:hypothetical protein